MAIALRALLEFEVFAPARPEVVAGAAGLDAPVRWVHSSEIYEIAPLLFGGELLLTTGLGLAGPDAGARRHYLRALAEVGVAGVALEIGRSLAQVPPELVEEAERLGLPLIVLHEVVPFIRITEATNTAIVDSAGASLRLAEEVTRALNDTLAGGGGIGGLLARAGAITRCPLVVISAGGGLVAVHGVGAERDAWVIVDSARHSVSVQLYGQTWGQLVAGSGSPLDHADLALVLERTAGALGLAVLLTGRPPSQSDRQAAELLSDLASGSALGDSDYALRAGLVGFRPPVGGRLVAVAVDAPETASALALLERTARRLGTPALTGRVMSTVLGLLGVRADAVDAVGAAQTAVEEVRRKIGATEMTVALGHAVPVPGTPQTLGASLRAARAALGLAVGQRAERTGAPTVVSARALALELELLDRGGRPLAELAGRSLEALIAWDDAHRSELVWTLEVLLRHGNSPTRAAAALHLGRQSLYQRIERIEKVLGHPVDDPALHASLLLATCAHRLSRS